MNDSITPMTKVPEYLNKTADIYLERNKLYKDNYKRVGAIFCELFPYGIKLNSATDFNRFALFNHMLNKITRYAMTWHEGNEDSLDDLSVYAMMLKELDVEKK